MDYQKIRETTLALATIACLTTLIAGCSSSDDSSTRPEVVNPQLNSGENRWFEHDYYAGQSCPPDPIINCTADLFLCKDGTAILLLTDIINGGKYLETKSSISTIWGIGDAPESIIFSIQPDFSLVDDQFGLSWTLSESGDGVDFCV